MSLPNVTVQSAVMSLLSLRTALHVQHLMARRHSQHVVLNDTYELASDAADKIAEQMMGAGIPFGIAQQDPIALIENMLGQLTEAKETLEYYPELVNTIDEVIGQFRQKVYLLKME